jgi:XTP/dITP diphosphohydrolase
MEIVVATHNQGKLKEIKKIFNEKNIDIISMDKLNIEIEVIEDGKTFIENSLKKAREICVFCKKATLADDSGLMVDYLDGRPGINSARYAGADANDNDRINKLLKELEGLDYEKRTAKFVCAAVIVFQNGVELLAEGKCEGIISLEPRGENGFGYDPIFYLPEFNCTMAELDVDLKNKISHRALAINILKEKLYKYIEENND